MGFGSHDLENDGKQNGFGFVWISKIFATGDAFFLVNGIFWQFNIRHGGSSSTHQNLGSTVFCQINALGVEAQNEALSLSDSDETCRVHPPTLSAENLIRISSVLSEIWPDKVKSRGRIYSSRRVYLAKYGSLLQGQIHTDVLRRSSLVAGIFTASYTW